MLNYYDQMAYEQLFDERVRSKMERQKQEYIKYFCSLVGADIGEEFAMILASAYEFGCPVAERIAKKFGFNQMDFLAIEENFEDFKQLLIEENSNHYIEQFL